MVLVKTYVRNAFNQVDRGAVIAAVPKRVPPLLPIVQWAYFTAGRLHIVRAPEGTPAVSSQQGACARATCLDRCCLR
jgi:hypothetical protein